MEKYIMSPYEFLYESNNFNEDQILELMGDFVYEVAEVFEEQKDYGYFSPNNSASDVYEFSKEDLYNIFDYEGNTPRSNYVGSYELVVHDDSQENFTGSASRDVNRALDNDDRAFATFKIHPEYYDDSKKAEAGIRILVQSYAVSLETGGKMITNPRIIYDNYYELSGINDLKDFFDREKEHIFNAMTRQTGRKFRM